MKNFVIASFTVFVSMASFGQKFFTKNAQINFDATSSSSPEKIDGINRSGTCVVDTKTGNLQFAVIMKAFAFEKALMEEHFNENYLESHKYPKAEFKGKIKDNDDINYAKDGTYTAKVKGTLTMHGESNDVDTKAIIIIKNGRISATADFGIKLSDYKISIPGIVADKVSKMATISVSCSLEPLKG